MRTATILAANIFLLGGLTPLGATAASDLSGVYKYDGDLRNATISKLEIKRENGRDHLHVWFYGKPDDVDWGETIATEYKNASMRDTPDLLATIQHGEGKAILSVRVGSAAGDKIYNITVRSWVSYEHPDDRHQNEVTDDRLQSVANSTSSVLR